MREEVEGLDGGELVAGGEEVAEIAHLRGGVAGNVNDGARAEGEKLLEEDLIAALARRVDDDDGVVGRECEAGEDRGGVAGEEGGVGDVVGGGVFAGELDRGFADLDAGDAFEGGRGCEGEEAAAAIGVDEEAGAGGGGLVADVGDEGGKNEGVVLEEVAGEEVEAERRGGDFRFEI